MDEYHNSGVLLEQSSDASHGANEGSHAFEEEPLEVLEAKLKENRESLSSVREAQCLNPDDVELATLVKDLEELVNLYQDLVDLRRASAGSATAQTVASQGREVDSAPASTRLDVVETPFDRQATGPGIVPGAQDSVAEGILDIDTTQLLQKTCYGMYEGEWYTAVILEVLNEVPAQVKVEYIGWGNQELVPLKEIQLIPPVPSLTRPGTSCWAVLSSDGLWHPGTIVNATASATEVTVRLDNSSPKEVLTLPRDWVSLRLPLHCVAQGSSQPTAPETHSTTKRSKRFSREIVTPGGYHIPEALRINPQDTERDKQIKKRKISLLKKAQRRELVEEEARNRQNTWKTHTAQTAKKTKTHVKKQSIFTTSDAPDAKVGVTGSGKGMTQFVTRSRHIFQEQDEEEGF